MIYQDIIQYAQLTRVPAIWQGMHVYNNGIVSSWTLNRTQSQLLLDRVEVWLGMSHSAIQYVQFCFRNPQLCLQMKEKKLVSVSVSAYQTHVVSHDLSVQDQVISETMVPINLLTGAKHPSFPTNHLVVIFFYQIIRFYFTKLNITTARTTQNPKQPDKKTTVLTYAYNELAYMNY